jgi:16S rRNA (cytidine1402-2'-O)-methyltransferase
LQPGLYLVATPIGNLGDITARALDMLRAADVIACEDTRVTRKLLSHYGIATPLMAYYEHNAAKVRPELLHRLARGQMVALVSDAGTPLISDPGYKLVRDAIAAGRHVSVAPGPSSTLAALCLAGLPTDRFLYAGFLPNKTTARRHELEKLAAIDATLVILESPQRLAASLADMAAVLHPARAAAVARELTKKFEDVRRGTLADLAAHYAAAGPPKGEVVVVVGPPTGEALPAGASDEQIAAALRAALARAKPSQAAAEVAATLGVSKRRVYAIALGLSHAPEPLAD